MSVVVIVNPIAGGCTRRRARARAACAAGALDEAGERGTVVLTERPQQGRELAGRALRDGARLVIAWGGDGTVHEVASALVGSETALGIVRSGSGNGLARALGVTPHPRRAILQACRATPRTIDAGECGGEPFFNLAGVGLDAEVAEIFDRRGAERRGLRTYLRIAGRQLVRYRPKAYRVDGRPTKPSLLITVANGSQFGNGARIAPNARVDDGLLDVVVFEEQSRLRTLLALPRLFTGGIAGVDGVSIRRQSRVSIEDDAPLVYHLDGEPRRGPARLEMVARPAALKVCVR